MSSFYGMLIPADEEVGHGSTMNEMANRKLLGLTVPSRVTTTRLPKLPLSPPAVFLIFVLISLLWLIFEVPFILPTKPKPPPFLWYPSQSRNISFYIQPEKQTALLDLKQGCSSSIQVLFIVPSSVNNSLQREVIRETWGVWIKSSKHRLLDTHIPQSSSNHVDSDLPSMKLVFILGKDESWPSNEVNAQILIEQNHHNDLIIEDFIDSYTNLTLKSIFILKWINMKCPNAKFVMKVDDDMFVNVPNLMRDLNSTKLKVPLMMGNLICNARPIQNRWSKWYSPSYMFQGKYPNYLSGTAYVFSGNLAEKLLSAAIQTPYFHLEDVYLTGICAKKIGVRPVAHNGFSYLKRAFNPCIYKDIITAHEVNPLQMKKLWSLLHNSSMMSKCKPTDKSVLKPPGPGKCIWK